MEGQTVEALLQGPSLRFWFFEALEAEEFIFRKRLTHAPRSRAVTGEFPT